MLSIQAESIPVTYPYPQGPNRPSKDFFGRLLPPLPSTTPPPASTIYDVGKTFSITGPTPKGRTETVVIKVVRPIELGYCQFTQSVIAHVESGPPYLLGRDVFVKVYDPLYIDPDNLPSMSII